MALGRQRKVKFLGTAHKPQKSAVKKKYANEHNEHKSYSVFGGQKKPLKAAEKIQIGRSSSSKGTLSGLTGLP